jgi:hypothetical protein
MVLYHSKSNLILVEPMRNRTEYEIIAAYKRIMKRMRKANLTIKKHILDNEASANYKEAIANNKVEYKLVPPNNYQQNQAERAIQTFKSHLIAIMCGIDNSFPMNLWRKLLPQAECTLNLLCQSNTVPTISAYTHMYGAHEYMKKPSASMGCATQCHDKPGVRHSWDPHSSDGWYIGTSMEQMQY